jgi:hypothetical protein
MNTVVELSPIVKTVHVRRTQADAFRLFTEEISAWWPLATHSRAQSAKGQEAVRATIEPRVGGRIYETLATGEELEWGEVLAWEPGTLFRMAWHLGRPQSTEVTVRFEARDPSSCRVTLTHARWENLGDAAADMRENYSGGWVEVFERGYGDLAGRF